MSGHDFPNLIIRASAGTGKTFQLSNRYLGLLNAGVAGEQILATTFTRKAAGEILERVILRLAHSAADQAECQQLASFVGDPSMSQDRCLALLQTMTKHLHRLRVGTLDSFFAQIARSFSLDLGLPPGWHISDELDDNALRKQAIEAVLHQENPQDLRTLLNLLTKGEATRGISQLVSGTVDQLYDLFQETERAAWTNLPRYQRLNDEELADSLEDLRTVELTDKRMAKARDEDYTRALSGHWQEFIAKGLSGKVIEKSFEYYRKAIPEFAVAIYERLVKHAKAELVGRVALQTEATYELLERFDQIYRRLKHDNRAMRFEDITRRLGDAHRPLQGKNEVDVFSDSVRLAFRLGGQIDHLLLDEFQDTSSPQWRAIESFARHVTRRDGGGAASRTQNDTFESDPPLDASEITNAANQRKPQSRSFFCVGDIKQAIYGWRGGVAEIFDTVGKQLEGLTEDSLNTSYRSSQPVIDTVNKIFTGLTNHPNLDRTENAVRHWCAGFVAHKTAKAELAGYTCLETAPRPSDDQDQHLATLEYAAARTAEIVGQARNRQIGVLVRKNDTVARLIYLLRKLQIPASEEGGSPLTDSAAVNVLLSMLRLADHPGDKISRFHVATGPLSSHLGLTDHQDHIEAARLSHRLRKQLLDEGYGVTIYRWAEMLAASCDRRELSRLQQMVELAYGYQSRATLRSGDFVRLVETQRVADPSTANVRVMTVHQAKGLEFDIVVLPELDTRITDQNDVFVVDRESPAGPVRRVCRYAGKEIQALMPQDLQRLFDDAVMRDVNESLCVLYVSVTRAIHALYMIIPPAKDNEKSLPKTFAGLLRAALRDDPRADPGHVQFEHGQRDWFQHGEQEVRHRASTESVPTPPLSIKLAPVRDTRRRGWARTSPSSLEGGARVAVANLFDSRGQVARQRGTMIHAFFEQIEWIENGRPGRDELRKVAAESVSRSIAKESIEQSIDEFYGMLDLSEVHAVLRRDRYPLGRELKVENERSIAYREGDQLMTGSIDRLVLQSDAGNVVAANIIDYKTDVLDGQPNTLAQKKEFYQPQIEAYRTAVSKLYDLDCQYIQAQLVFLATGAIVTL